MQGYICNMCRVVNKAQYKTTWNYQMKFDMWNSRVWSRSLKIAVKFDGAGQLVSYRGDTPHFNNILPKSFWEVLPLHSLSNLVIKNKHSPLLINLNFHTVPFLRNTSLTFCNSRQLRRYQAGPSLAAVIHARSGIWNDWCVVIYLLLARM